MTHALRRASIFAGACGLVACVAFPSLPAQAKATVQIQQSDGSSQTYDDVSVKLVKNQALHLTTADGKGTLIINKAACSYIGEIQRCLPYSASLDQGGSTKPIDFKDGTAYANMTDQNQTLPLSSQQLPPRGIVMLLKTKIGTFISVKGTIDEVTQ